MPSIRPLADLNTHTGEILRICLQEEQPVFLTKNGHGKLVVMSQQYFEKMQAMTRLYAKLEEAEKAAEAGDKGISHKEMLRRARGSKNGRDNHAKKRRLKFTASFMEQETINIFCSDRVLCSHLITPPFLENL